MNGSELVAWLAFIMSMVIYLLTFAIAFGKMTATGQRMAKDLEGFRSDIGAFRSEVNAGFTLMREKLEREAIHGVGLSGRVDALQHRMDRVEDHNRQRIP